MIKYKSGYKYQLVEAYARKIPLTGYSIFTEYIILDVQGNLVIKKGYAWDGATGFPDIEEVIEASLVHDAGYQLISIGCLSRETKKVWDDIFTEIVDEVCKRLQRSKIESKMLEGILHKGVELFGFNGLGPERPVITTP